jgi:hypothetical protein
MEPRERITLSLRTRLFTPALVLGAVTAAAVAAPAGAGVAPGCPPDPEALAVQQTGGALAPSSSRQLSPNERCRVIVAVALRAVNSHQPAWRVVDLQVSKLAHRKNGVLYFRAHATAWSLDVPSGGLPTAEQSTTIYFSIAVTRTPKAISRIRVTVTMAIA